MNGMPLAKVLSDFERKHQVSLPVEYREYLLAHVGVATNTISSLDEWYQPYLEEEMPSNFLAMPFPHKDAWNDTALFDAKLGWKSLYYSTSYFTGSIRFENLGCEEYALLVITGSEKGRVWIDARASKKMGIYPASKDNKRRVSFCEYLEMRKL